MVSDVSKEILALCEKVTAKRPRAVIDAILEKGFVTTEDLQSLSYDHAPRAARDVRENGIPLETFKVKSSRTGRMIAAYRFGNPDEIKDGRLGGRQVFSKQFKQELIDHYGERDHISGAKLEARYLQIDHRIPYEVSGDDNLTEKNVADYMLIDASMQRAKSWSCENCINWQRDRNKIICQTCYWAFPESYQHIALKPSVRIELVFDQSDEISLLHALTELAKIDNVTLSDFLKEILFSYIQSKEP
jgi:hypothetical protein